MHARSKLRKFTAKCCKGQKPPAWWGQTPDLLHAQQFRHAGFEGAALRAAIGQPSPGACARRLRILQALPLLVDRLPAGTPAYALCVGAARSTPVLAHHPCMDLPRLTRQRLGCEQRILTEETYRHEVRMWN